MELVRESLSVVKIFLVAISVLIPTGVPVALADTKPFKAPGQLIELQTHRMHLNCTGADDGSPVVILDSGMGGSHMDWVVAQPKIAEFSRVCSYDRSGYAWSSASAASRNSANIAEELHELLAAAKVAPPYLLVGHSFGGFNVRVFAARYPQFVAGLLLIDSSHENQFDEYERRAKVNLAPRNKGFIMLSPPGIPDGIPGRYRVEARHILANTPSMMTQRNELLWFRDSAEDVRANVLLPAVPLIVLTRGKGVWRNKKYAALKESIWQELQRDMLTLSTDSMQVVASDSGHYIHLEQTDLVVASVREIQRVASAKTAELNPVTEWFLGCEQSEAKIARCTSSNAPRYLSGHHF